MPAWIDNGVGGSLDAMLNDIKTRANGGNIELVTSYAQGEDYATVVGRTVATAAITSGDFTGPETHNTNDRRLVFNGASTTASGDATSPDLHMVITNGTDTILAVSDESTNQDIVSGNTVNFGTFQIRALQPTSQP